MTIVKNDLYDYPNRYIYQESDGFKFSLDSVLLAEFTNIPKTAETILDLCTGNAPIPLIISTKTKCKIYGYEIQKKVHSLGIKSVKMNKLEEQIELINDNFLNINKLFPGKYFDIITCNPPFFKVHKNSILNKNDLLTIARHEVTATLEDIFKVVSEHLKDNGSFYMVHRPERLDEIILTAEKYKLKLKKLEIIITKETKPTIILLKFQKHAQYGIKVKTKDISNRKSYQGIFKGE